MRSFHSTVTSSARTGRGLDHLIVAFIIAPVMIVYLGSTLLTIETNFWQLIYFLIGIGVYVTTMPQHALPEDRRIKFADQTLIGWFIPAVALPFIYHEWWAASSFLVVAALLALYKWFGRDRSDEESNLVFLALGAVSLGLMMYIGVPAIGTGYQGAEAKKIFGATFFFLLALCIFAFQWPKPVPVLKHINLAIAIVLCTDVVASSPV